MDCASRDWQICQNYKQSAIIFIRKFWMSSGHDSSALSFKALDQRMLSGSCYFRLWALLWVGWRDLESDWILRADEPWKVQGVDVMPHSNCPGNFFRFRNISAAAVLRTRTQPWGNNSGIKMRQSDKMWARVIMAKCLVIWWIVVGLIEKS